MTPRSRAAFEISLLVSFCQFEIIESLKVSLLETEVIFLGSVSTVLVHVCPSRVGGRPPHSQGQVFRNRRS